jgi:hypothetical protein
MFDVYAKEIEIEVSGRKNTYKLYPLSGEALPTLFELISNLNMGKDATEEEMLKTLAENGNIKKLHKLVFDTLKYSYPKEDDKVLEMFVTQNLFKFIQPLMEVNMGKQN